MISLKFAQRIILASLASFAILGSASTANAAGPGSCELLSLGEAAALITTRDVTVRLRTVRKDAEETDCVWTARQNGLTDEAPPEGVLTLRVIRKASPAAANKDMADGLAKGASLALARTADPSDEQLDWTGDRFAARRGTLIAVADGSDAVSMAREKQDWRYRLQVLALRAVGATVVGPTAEAADACDRVPKPQMLAVLTLQASRIELTPDGWGRCMVSVKDQSGEIDGWTRNGGHADLRISDLGSNTAALKFLRQQLPFLKPSTRVKTQDATDRVVVSPDHPEEVWAVHGPYYVELGLTDVTAQARSHPTWIDRVQRVALQAAGAAIIPTAAGAPDPVVPEGRDRPSPDDRTDEAWTPPPHDPPPWGGILEPIALVAFFLSHYRFFVLPAALLSGIPLSIWRSTHAKAQGRSSLAWLFPVLGGALGLGSLLFGPLVSSSLVYAAGRSAAAIITRTYDTGSQYNNHDILGHNVLIRTAPDRLVQARFSSDQFNVYPSHNRTSYPGQGTPFTVRYLPHFPRAFVIVGDDGSPFARHLRCGAVLNRLDEARTRAQFGGVANGSSPELTKLQAEASAAGCNMTTN